MSNTSTEESYAAQAFLSYAHSDNEREGGRILRLAQLISDEFTMLTGSKIKIFTDRSEIEWGNDFRDKLDTALEETTFFIPVLTPTYFLREECRNEMQTFVSSAQRLGLDRLLLSLRYTQVPDLQTGSADNLKALAARMQFVPWERMRFLEESSAEHRAAINGLAERLVRLTADLEGASPEQSPPAGSIVAATEADPVPPDGAAEIPGSTAASVDVTPVSAQPADDSPHADLDVLDDDDAPGTLDLIADILPAFHAWNDTISEVSAATTAFNDKFRAATENIPAVNESSDSLSRRILAFRKLASDIEPELAEIERLSQKYAAGVQRLDPGLRALAEYASSEDANAEAASQALVNLGRQSSEAMTSLTTAADAARDNAKHSRDLRPVLRRFETAARNIVDASRTINEWERLFALDKR